MSNIGVKLGPAIGVANGSVFIQAETAVAAVATSQMVLGATGRAPVGQLAAGHGDKVAFGALNDFQIADNEGVVKGDGAEGM